jgi:hypothetical protein
MASSEHSWNRILGLPEKGKKRKFGKIINPNLREHTEDSRFRTYMFETVTRPAALSSDPQAFVVHLLGFLTDARRSRKYRLRSFTSMAILLTSAKGGLRRTPEREEKARRSRSRARARSPSFRIVRSDLAMSSFSNCSWHQNESLGFYPLCVSVSLGKPAIAQSIGRFESPEY